MKRAHLRRWLGRQVVVLFLAATWAGVASAQLSPRYGGTLLFSVGAEPVSMDGHREDSFDYLTMKS